MTLYTRDECESYLREKTGLPLVVSLPNIDHTIALEGRYQGVRVLEQSPAPNSVLGISIPSYLHITNTTLDLRIRLIELLKSSRELQEKIIPSQRGLGEGIISFSENIARIRRCTSILLNNMNNAEIRMLYRERPNRS